MVILDSIVWSHIGMTLCHWMVLKETGHAIAVNMSVSVCKQETSGPLRSPEYQTLYIDFLSKRAHICISAATSLKK